MAGQSVEQLSDIYSFHSITLPSLKRARQDRKIEVSCSGVDIQIEVKERENAARTQKSRDVALRHHWLDSLHGTRKRRNWRSEADAANRGGDCEQERGLEARLDLSEDGQPGYNGKISSRGWVWWRFRVQRVQDRTQVPIPP